MRQLVWFMTGENVLGRGNSQGKGRKEVESLWNGKAGCLERDE